jgi:small-conductance mechanosensitive channel
MLEPNRELDNAVAHTRDLSSLQQDSWGGRRLVARTAGCLILVLALWLAAAPANALAQDSGDPPTTSVSVSEEPGVCTTQTSLCERLLDWTGNETFSETTAWLLGTPLRIIAILGIAVLANRLARRSIRGVASRFAKLDLPDAFVSDRTAERSQQRADAVGAMLRSSATALIFGIAGVAMLDTLGVSVIPILASLGIVGIAVGFGAQSLIEDLISGIMLILEDQLGVGDRVDVGVVEGDVERVTLRSTVILARNGVRWYVPNSEIKHVANESQHNARASVKIGVASNTNLRDAASTFHEATLNLVAEERWRDAGVQDVRKPFVAELGENANVLEIRLFVHPTERRSLERTLRERLAEVAAGAGIELPNNQLDVWIRSEAS